MPEKSPHVRGAAIDISYIPMNEENKRWMSKYLLDLEEKGIIEATKETFQPCFHIMVFKRYLNYVKQLTKLNDAQFASYYESITRGRL